MFRIFLISLDECYKYFVKGNLKQKSIEEKEINF